MAVIQLGNSYEPHEKLIVIGPNIAMPLYACHMDLFFLVSLKRYGGSVHVLVYERKDKRKRTLVQQERMALRRLGY